VAFSEARNELAIGSSDDTISLLAADTWAIRQRWTAHDNSVFCLRYHPQKTAILLSGGRDAQLKAWDLSPTPPTLVNGQSAHWYTLNDLCFSPDRRYLLTASRDKTIRIWDATNYRLLRTLNAARDGGHINSVNRLLWLPNTNYFASAGDDRSIIIWQLEN
ncbi:MAG: WD40 repeat domain-containing protein, partial [Bacteroidota bacterium]